MNSPKDPSNPPSKTTPQVSVSTEPTPQQQIQQLLREKASISQLLWEAVRLYSPDTHRMVLPSKISDPLWQIAFVRGSDDEHLEVLAGTIPDMTEQDKKRIVRFLRGTPKKLEDALASLEIEWPSDYVRLKIADRIVFHDGAWESVTPPTLGEKIKNAVHWPK